MRFYAPFLASALVLLGPVQAKAADVEKVMCAQFAIDGATETVAPSETLDGVFSTPHHGPRNVPIAVNLPAEAAYTHFPIVEPGVYLILANDPERLVAVKYKGGEAAPTTKIPAATACASTLTGGLSVNLTDDKVKGPTPIAIEYGPGSAGEIKIIVSRSPLN